MAKRRVRRFKKRTVRWCSNIQEINDTSIQATPFSFTGVTTLVTNPVQSNQITSQVYTVKNFDINFTIEGSVPTIEAVTAYIMFVPQGMNITDDYNINHPEYILNYKYLGSPSNNTTNSPYQQFQPTRLRTRLARKLQTGDSIILLIKGYNKGSSTSLELSGLIRWWTKGN